MKPCKNPKRWCLRVACGSPAGRLRVKRRRATAAAHHSHRGQLVSELASQGLRGVGAGDHTWATQARYHTIHQGVAHARGVRDSGMMSLYELSIVQS